MRIQIRRLPVGCIPLKMRNSGRRFPGRPRGCEGKTRPKLKHDVVKAAELKDRCERCGSPLGEPSYVNHR